MIDTLLAAAASFAVLAVVFGPLERLFPARAQRIVRPELATDVCFFAGQYFVFASVATALLVWVHGAVAAHLGLAELRSAVASQHVVVQGAMAVFLGDLVVYWFHRACHTYDLLWRFHAVHHSVEHLDWVAAHREHPLDGLSTQLLLNLPGIVLGVSFDALGAVIVLRGMWAVFIHSNVSLPVGPLRYLLGEPALHRWHHARVPRTMHNFANLAPYLDVIFGTYHRPRGEGYELGLVDPWPRGYVAQIVRPFGVDVSRWRFGTPVSRRALRPAARRAHGPTPPPLAG
jgi:sterol desaturase/sphingolipid hydroxylase (fatty acid hydroxylase superfamily)